MKKVLGVLLILISTVSFGKTMTKNIVLEDTVRKFLGPDKVIFNTHAAVYKLKSDAKNFESIKKTLEAGIKSGEKVKLEVDPNTLVIEDVVK